MSETVISLNDLTSTTDTLVELVKVRLNEEFTKGRITGKEYSSVYLGGLNTAIQQSLEFVLQKDQSAAQADLIKNQSANVISEIAYRAKQGDLLDKEIELKTKQIIQTEEQTKLIQEQILIAKQDVLIKQKQLEQMVFEVQKAEQEALLTGLMKAKTEAETALLVQKKITEEGQPAVMDKQKALYDAQIQGFADDNTQKSSRLITEMWNTLTVADPTAPRIPAGLDDALDAIVARIT
jgi:hypothetical protein